MKKTLAFVLSCLLILGVWGSAAWVAAQTPDVSGLTAFVFNGNTLTVKQGSDENFEVVVYSSEDTETAPASSADASGNIVYSVPSGAKGELQVAIKKAGGNYVFSGNGTGHIVVKKAATGDASLYFNGLTLTSGFTAVVSVNKDSTAKCNLIALKGTVNTFTDSTNNNDETNPSNLAAENAVIKCKAASNVTIGGEGTFKVKANAKNGIKANHLLTVTDSVTLNIEAVDDGISGENTVNILSGYVTIKAKEGDGIQCGADDAPTGTVNLCGGTVTIDSYGDGVQATANVNVTGGVLKITCYGGYTASYNGDSDAYPSAKGLKAGGSYLNTSGVEVDATECYLKITGGFIEISSPDDAIHSDKDVTVSAGVLDLYTADDGVHANYTNTIGTKGGKDTDLYLNIHKCYEGIEGANIYIHSGIVNVFASDDSINAANSSLGSSAPGQNSAYNFSVDITGGVIYCASTKGDCLDSNKNFTISGGTLVVLGSITQQDNTAVDVDGSFNIKGGQILTIGNSGMLTNPTTTQSYCSWTSQGTATASASGSSSGQPGQIGRPGRPGQPGGMPGASGGSVVSNNQQLTITDSSGNTLISVLVKWDGTVNGSASYALYSSPKVASGSSYTLSVGTAEAVTGGSYITSLGIAAQPQTPETDQGDLPSTDNTGSSSSTSTPEIPSQSQPESSQPTPPSPPSGDNSQPQLPPNMKKGDVNEDGEINAKDALMVLKIAVNKIVPTQEQEMCGDLNGDRKVNATDALWILQYAVGKRPSF